MDTNVDTHLSDQMFRALAIRVLGSGGSVSVAGLRWRRKCPNKGESVTFVREDIVTFETRTWSCAEYAVDDVINTTSYRRNLDATVFYGKDDAGVTWRMLKADCPFLSMLFGTDNKVLQVLDARISYLNSLIDRAMRQEEGYDDRN